MHMREFLAHARARSIKFHVRMRTYFLMAGFRFNFVVDEDDRNEEDLALQSISRSIFYTTAPSI